MRPLVLVIAAAALLVAPAAVHAKEIAEVSVCGTGNQCVTYDESDFKSLMFLAEDAGPAEPPAAAAPWYRLRYTAEHGGERESWTIAYVPSFDLLRVRGESAAFEWVALNSRTARVLRRAADALPAYPAATLRGLKVEQPAAREPSGSTPSWGWWLATALGAAGLALLAASRVMRAEGLEPPRLAPPAPKAGASTNSATPAAGASAATTAANGARRLYGRAPHG